MKSIIFMFLVSVQLHFGQSGGMVYYNYPRTLSSFGLGEQGVASDNGIDGLIYNPANLVHSKGTQVSFYRNPFYYLGFDGMPIKSVGVVTELPNDIQLGAEYMSWDMYGSYVSDIDQMTTVDEHFYNRTFAFAAATHLSPEWGAGIHARYTKDHVGRINTEHLYGSAGVQFIPASFQDQLRIGFSMMNFSTPSKFSITTGAGTTQEIISPPSSFIRLGVEYDIARTELFRTTVHIEVSKELSKWNGNEGQSSFQSLFDDWDNTPQDMSIHGGISFLFRPIPLGRSVTFVQEIYAGYLHDGPKAGRQTMFYNGFNAGFGYGGTTVTAGYAGLWHIVDDDVYSLFTNNMPWETFQVSLRSELSGVRSFHSSAEERLLERTIISLSGGYVLRTGRASEMKVPGPLPEYYIISTNNAPAFSIESAFYITPRSALTAHFRYEHRSITYSVFAGFFGGPPSNFQIPVRMETLTLTSSYRYHPLQDFEPLMFETGIGVQRQNPIENTRPRYKYNTVFHAGTGTVLPVDAIIVTPKVTFVTLMDRIHGSAPRLGGFNHFEFSLSIGYLFE